MFSVGCCAQRVLHPTSRSMCLLQKEEEEEIMHGDETMTMMHGDGTTTMRWNNNNNVGRWNNNKGGYNDVGRWNNDNNCRYCKKLHIRNQQLQTQTATIVATSSSPLTVTIPTDEYSRLTKY
ncbi:hypothetical protein KY290_027279 [Solanum tuberosum]|uniref:Integrase core domain containing protein n=1 Tax=Solanum tuberosum TaxID=4113 RepID=A0ABQ7UEP1_SOLTU|nr:hypothetical protein KY290_027279 [Solanum tuberosum]